MLLEEFSPPSTSSAAAVVTAAAVRRSPRSARSFEMGTGASAAASSRRRHVRHGHVLRAQRRRRGGIAEPVGGVG